MTEKIALTLYNILGWLVAVSTVCLIFGVLINFGVQANKQPVFSCEGVAVQTAPENDAELASRGFTSDGWYRIEYRMSVSGPKLSPYTYTAGYFEPIAPKEYKYSGSCFAVLDAPLSFTNTSPDSFVLTLYLYSSLTENEVADIARETGFGMRDFTRSFSFLEAEILSFLPHFMMSDFSEATIAMS